MKPFGCLLVHGLTGTPANLSNLQSVLERGGFVVEAPLVAGHGKTPKILGETTWTDWYGSVRAAYEILNKKCDKIFYCGLSMGSLLGVKLAVELGRKKIPALIVMGFPLLLDFPIRRFSIPLFRYTPLRWIVSSVKKNFAKSVKDPKGLEIYKKQSLHRIPVESVIQLVTLAEHIEDILPRLTQPTLAIHAAEDRIADIEGVRILKAKSPASVETMFLRNSYHVVTLDYEREMVTGKVMEYFRRQSH